MAIEFNCPDCLKTLRAPEEKSGIDSTCPNCGAPVRVPYSEREQYRDRSSREDNRQTTFDDEPDATDSYRERNQHDKRFRRREMQPASGFALTSMITGIIALMMTFTCCFWFLGVPFSITAVITALVSKRKNEEATSMAMIGRICGSLAGLIQLAVTTYYIIIFAEGPNN